MSCTVFLALVLLSQSKAEGPAKPSVSPADIVSALESAMTDAIAKAEPSVVAITRRKGDNPEETTAVRGRAPDPAAEGFVGLPGLPQAAEDEVAMPGDYGSGVVIGQKGEILTAFHLLKGAKSIQVRAPGGQKFFAEILASDPRSDLAVIAPRVTPGTAPPTLKPIAIGDASKLHKGSFLVALGNPYNAARDGRASASWGILSNLARRIDQPYEDAAHGKTPPIQSYPSLMQLDAKLNLGMSGGAVVNLKGELVGLTTTGGNVISFDAQAGYAVPMDALGRRIAEALMEGKEVEYGFLGVSLERGTNRIKGARPGTPADDAGLMEGDRIIAVADRPVPEDEGLSLALSAEPPGSRIKLKILRHGQVLEETVTLAKYRVDGLGPQIITNRPDPWRGVRVDFISVLVGPHETADLAESYKHGGVGITELDTGSAAETAGLKRGQVITEVDGRPVRTPAEFAKAVGGRKGPVTLTTELGNEPGKKITVK